ncbi:hypothetical protein BN193_06210 [Lactococcus raffinolactis 4877]|nr:hypothetical protein BN193_06210 [Lactococcus raffinolactis 4877]
MLIFDEIGIVLAKQYEIGKKPLISHICDYHWDRLGKK